MSVGNSNEIIKYLMVAVFLANYEVIPVYDIRNTFIFPTIESGLCDMDTPNSTTKASSRVMIWKSIYITPKTSLPNWCEILQKKKKSTQ